MMNSNRVIILANGSYPTHATPLALLQSGLPVVCCDGAANRFVSDGGSPLAIIGDGDSLSDAVRERFAEQVVCIPEQETNDLTKAVNYVKRLGYTDICILGATGLRECHTLGNISLLMHYYRKGLRVQMFTDHSEIIPCSGEITVPSFSGQQVSIINFNATNFRSEGLRYPIYDFKEWWQGTLNESFAPEITITAQGDYLLILDYV